MRPTLLILLCVAGLHAAAQSKTTGSSKAKIVTDSKWRSPTGFGATRWGMTKAEVKKTFSKEVDKITEDLAPLLCTKSVIAAQESLNCYSFVEGHLYQASVNFRPRRPIASWRDEYDRIKALLVQKYGESKAEAKWSNPHFQDRPTQFDEALVAGHVELVDQWSNNDTTVELKMKADEVDAYPGISIEYASKSVVEAWDKIHHAKVIDDL